MAYYNATAPGENSITGLSEEISGHYAAFRNLIQFLNGSGIVDYGSVVVTPAAGTRDGEINYLDTCKPSGGNGTSVAETWTITFTSSTTFGVTGSVSGAQAAGTVGVNYTSALEEISFLVTQGTAAEVWANTDTIVFNVIANPNTAANDKYEILNVNVPTVFTRTREVALKSIGLSGSDEIFHQAYADESGVPANTWFVAIRASTGYNDALPMGSQPGITAYRYTASYDGTINYWYVANGRRYIAVSQVSTTMRATYSGWFLTYSTPTEYPYPFLIGGEKDDPAIKWNDGAATGIRHFIDPDAGSSAILAPDGTEALQDSNLSTDTSYPRMVWPWRRVGTASTNFILALETFDSEHTLLPATVINQINTNAAVSGLGAEAFGVLDGVYGVNGLSLSPATSIVVGGDTYLVVNNISLLDEDDYWALKLE